MMDLQPLVETLIVAVIRAVRNTPLSELEELMAVPRHAASEKTRPAATPQILRRLRAFGVFRFVSTRQAMLAGGTILGAAGEAPDRSRRERRLAARAMTEPRSTAQARVPDDVPAWTSSVASQWTPIEQFERNGRQFFLALDNRLGRGIEPLSRRERHVVRLSLCGLDNIAIANELGIAHSTVRVLMARASAKCARPRLGRGTQSGSPPGTERRGSRPDAMLYPTSSIASRWMPTEQLERDGRRFVLGLDDRLTKPLSPRERDVVLLSRRGLDGKAIGDELGIAHSTVRVLMARASAKGARHGRTPVGKAVSRLGADR